MLLAFCVLNSRLVQCTLMIPHHTNFSPFPLIIFRASRASLLCCFFSFILIIVKNKAATNTSWKAKNTKCSFLRVCDRREAVLEVKNTFAQFRCIQLGRDVIGLRNVLNHFLSCVAVRLCVTKGNSSTIILPFHFAPKNIGFASGDKFRYRWVRSLSNARQSTS